MCKDILANLIITKTFSASTIYTQKNTKGKRIARDRWAIIIKYEGETLYTNNGKKYISNINNLIILPNGSSYEWLCTKSGHYMSIEFECKTICNEILGFNVSDGDTILNIFKKLEYKRAMKKYMYEVESIMDVYSIIIKLAETVNRNYLSSDKRKKVLPVMEYMVKNYNKDIKNDDLAKIAGMSTVYFRKLFSEVYKTSPITYMHNLRIKKAKEMLQSDYGSISDIALSLGYKNIYDFSRAFKKNTGRSPTKYKLHNTTSEKQDDLYS